MADSTLKNELIVMVPETDWDPKLVEVVRGSGTNTITVDQARSFRTPFGNYMIIATLGTNRKKASSYDLKDYLSRVLVSNGLSIKIEDILVPGRSKRFSGV